MSTPLRRPFPPSLGGMNQRLRKCILGGILMLQGAASEGRACEPTRRDDWGCAEVWCCCDANWRECAVFGKVNGAANGDFWGTVAAREYC